MDSYDIKRAYKRLKKENDGIKHKAMRQEMAEIDQYISNSTIDDSFYERYFEIKKKIRIDGEISLSIVLSVLTSMAVSFAMMLLVPEEEIVGACIAGAVAFLAIATIIIYYIVRWFAAPKYDELYKHMIKAMEKKMEEKNDPKAKGEAHMSGCCGDHVRSESPDKKG